MYPLVTNCIFEMRKRTAHLCSSEVSGGSGLGLIVSLVFAFSVGGLAGCASEAQPEPLLNRICTAKSSTSCTDWVYAGEIVPVRIEGQNLLQTWQVDLGKDEPPQAVGSFRAWIGPAELKNVEKLPTETHSGWEILQAQIPDTLDVGYYPVRIETPAGSKKSFPGPVLVRTPLFVSAEMQKLHAPVQDTLRMVIKLENKSMAALGDVSITLSQGGTGSVFLPPPPPAFSLDAQSSLDIVMDLTGASPGQPQIQVQASAKTGQGLELEENELGIVTLDILDAAFLQVQAQAEPAQLVLGQNLDLVLTVQNTGGVAVNDARLAIQSTVGQGQLQFDSSSVIRDVDPGSEAVFTMSATATGEGHVDINPVITGTEAISGRPVEFAPNSPVGLEISQQ